MNNCTFIGRTTRDPELRYLPSGDAVLKTSIAVSERWKDRTTGEMKEEAMFLDIVVFGKSAETFNQYVQKGHQIAVIGKLKLEAWTDQASGQKRSKHILKVESFEFLEKKSDNQDSAPQQRAPQQKSAPQDDFDPEFPF